MKITNIAIVGTSEYVISNAFESTKVHFEKLGYTVLFGKEEDLSPETEKVLVICHGEESDIDAVFYIGDESSDEGKKIISSWTGHPHFRIIGDRYIKEK